MRAEGVADLGSVERDAHGAATGAVLGAAVVGDVGEVEARHGLPHVRIEQLRDTGILHTWDNRSRGHRVSGPPRGIPVLRGETSERTMGEATGRGPPGDVQG
ncbi:hypothetical protein GCM10023222_08230 [Saccharopolyspora cebuensis]